MPDVLEDASAQPRRIQRYGWKPSLPDLRDHIADASELAVRDEVDPRGELPPVFDQGQLGMGLRPSGQVTPDPQCAPIPG